MQWWGGREGDEGEDTKQRGFILENFERFHDHTFNLKNMYMLIFLNYNPFWNIVEIIMKIKNTIYLFFLVVDH